jgi:D-glycero-alpha-D-manno-heptose 1-phosphate guanylyltransferase
MESISKVRKDYIDMEAIVLAGGFGTRLRQVITDVPKPMAPIGERPFLSYIFDYLKEEGITRIILSTGYKHEVIFNYFKHSYNNIHIDYSIENEPLGTGGAIKKALELCEQKHIYILNGDTYFNISFKKVQDFHHSNDSKLTLALKPMRKFDRYGTVEMKETRVIKFNEKKYMMHGNINGGVYLINSDLLHNIELPEKFSFEVDFLEKQLDKLEIHGLIFDNYFIDIGIPEDYQRAQSELMDPI